MKINQSPLSMFDRKRLIAFLLFAAAFLVIGHLLREPAGRVVWPLERLFDMDRESNIPAWFSSVLLFGAAMAAFRCNRLSAWNFEKRTWLGLVLVLTFMSCDEIAMIHETLGSSLARKLQHWSSLHHVDSSHKAQWPVLLSPLALIIFVWLGCRLRKCFRGSCKAASYVFSGALVFVAGSMGLELTRDVLASDEALLPLWKLEIVFEEAFEMLGAILVLNGLLIHGEWLHAKCESGRAEKIVATVAKKHQAWDPIFKGGVL